MFDYTWAIAVASIIGTIANVCKKKWCFYVWFGTNSFWCIYDLCLGLYSQSLIYFVYVILAVWGLISWQRSETTGKNNYVVFQSELDDEEPPQAGILDEETGFVDCLCGCNGCFEPGDYRILTFAENSEQASASELETERTGKRL